MGYFDDTVKNHLAAIRSAASSAAGPLPPLTSAETLMGIALQPGQRVIDKQSGAQGTVISGTIQHTITAAAKPKDAAAAPSFFALPTPGRKTLLSIQLDGAGIVTRTPAEVVLVPSTLTLPLSNLLPPG